jgi:predicted permease
VNALIQDLRYALRTLRRARSVTAVAVLMLGLGLGTTTAIGSVVYAVLLRPLPFRDAGQITDVTLTTREHRGAAGYGTLATWDLYQAWRTHAPAVGAMAAYTNDYALLSGLGSTQQIPTLAITSNMTSFLGVQPLLGRSFVPQEDDPGAPPVALISEPFWTEHFARDPAVVGRALTLDGKRVEIVGVMPADFAYAFAAETDIWLPIGPVLGSPRVAPGRPLRVNVFARLASGASIQTAQAQLDQIVAPILGSQPGRARSNQPLVTQAIPLRHRLVFQVERPLWLLLGAVGILLLIACANVANLLLARAATRQREIAIRTALGASRRRVTRQLLTESMVLALLGGALGMLLALWGVPLLVRLASAELPDIGPIGLNAPVLAMTLATTVATGLLFGLAPALQTARGISAGALKEDTTGAGLSGWRHRASDAFVVAEVTLALVLLAGMGLLARSFLHLAHTDRGYDVDRIVMASASLPTDRYATPAQQLAFSQMMLARVRAIPGASDAALTTMLPTPGLRFGTTVSVPGTDLSVGAHANEWSVSAAYFHTMGIPLVRGRSFRAGDDPNAVVIDQAAARTLFRNANPIGQRVAWGRSTDRHTGTVVGVAGDIQEFSTPGGRGWARSVEPTLYTRFTSSVGRSIGVVVRSEGNPARLAQPLRSVIAGIDSTLSWRTLVTMRSAVSERFGRERFLLTMTGILASIALAMAAAGIFAVVMYAAARRTRELGIRMALGAQRADIFALTMWRGLLPTLVGLAIGLAGALATTRVLRSLLFEISPVDPLTLGGVAATLVAVALLASWLPARQATRVDPLVALRDE